VLSKGGVEVARAPLLYDGEASRFRGTLSAEGPGAHEILVYAFHPETGNTGLDRTTVIIQ
jgi:hypothetical protein